MKHDGLTTMKLLLWTALMCGIGIIFATQMPQEIPVDVSLWAVGLVALIAIAFGTLLWILILRYKKTKTLYFYGIGMGLATETGVLHLVNTIPMQLVMTGVVASSIIIYMLVVQKMQKSWKATRKLLWYCNIMTGCSIALAGASISRIFPPILALAFLGIMAIYDAIAVWKTGHMQTMAKGFMEQRIIPGLAIAKEKENEFAILGGGDVFFIIVVAGSFVKTSLLATIATGVGMFVALTILFLLSKAKKFYPALPFIFAGAIVGVLWVLL